MKKKKLLPALAAVIATAVALAGCSTGGASPTAKPSTGATVTLKLLTFETPNLTPKYWHDIIAKTSAQVPGVKIDQIVAPSSETRDAYARQLDSTGQLPDIMVAISPDGLAQQGKLAAFTPSQLKDWVAPTANSFAGKTYQLPTNTQTWQAFYNKALFAKAGIQTPPTTWSALLADAGKLKAAGIPPFVIGGGPDTNGPEWFFEPIVANETYAHDKNFLKDLVANKTNFSNPLFVNALKQADTIAQDGYVDQAALSKGYADTQSAFLAGEGAMYVMGSWFPAAPSTSQQSKFGVFPIPTNSGALVLPAFTGGGLSVSSSSKDVAKAQAWAIAFSKENVDAGARYDSLFPALKDAKLPSDLPALYNETYALYKKAIAKGTITTSIGQEGGTVSLPAGFAADLNAALLDLLSGRATVDQTVQVLNSKYTELSK
jgi:ABC-type glycerol-3-phosphate transport system substrate-binding protein